MGDILAMLDRLNLSPLNTVLLLIGAYFVREILRRLARVEHRTGKHHTSIAVIKNKLEIVEDD